MVNNEKKDMRRKYVFKNHKIQIREMEYMLSQYTPLHRFSQNFQDMFILRVSSSFWGKIWELLPLQHIFFPL